MKNRQDLKKLFINGAKPSEKDFAELIDSSFNKIDERRQEVVSNAGWYYFRFLPYHYSQPIFEVDNESTAFRAQRGEKAVGGMNIFVPKGVSQIDNLFVKARIETFGGTTSLDFRLWLPLHEGPPHSNKIYSDKIERRGTGIHPISETLLPVEKRIDPNSDYLFIEIEGNKSNPGATGIMIYWIGIKFS